MAEIATIDYTLGQDNVQVLGLDVHNPVFVVSSLTIVAFVAGVLAFPVGAATAFGALRTGLMSTADWVFMGAGNLCVLFCLLLVATPLGRVRLGGADAQPDYSRSVWFAMLFAAGTGIGLMFFGVSERRCCMNTLWGWGRASWAGCGPDVRRGGQTLIMGYSADKSPLIGHLAGPLRRLEPLGAQRQEKCGPNRPTPTGYSCNNASLRARVEIGLARESSSRRYCFGCGGARCSRGGHCHADGRA